jgi:hypothetical protein
VLLVSIFEVVAVVLEGAASMEQAAGESYKLVPFHVAFFFDFQSWYPDGAWCLCLFQKKVRSTSSIW